MMQMLAFYTVCLDIFSAAEIYAQTVNKNYFSVVRIDPNIANSKEFVNFDIYSEYTKERQYDASLWCF